jgi:chromosome segregation ATPase
MEMKENQKNKNNNDIIIEENKNQIINLNDEISYLKLQLQLKDSENKRINRLYKENIDLLKELNNENNSLKEKLKLLTDKINELQTNNYEELNSIRDKMNSLEAKNRLYEEQDIQFDKIFSEILLDIEKNNNDEEAKNMIMTINELQKGNNKKRSQFILLANKLKKMSEQNAILSAKLQNAQIENEKYKEQSNIYQNMAQSNNEPYEYLLKEIAKKDSELTYYKELMNEKEIRYKAVMKENERLNERCNEIEKDLKQHLENRDKIDKLDYLVEKIAENQRKFLGGENFDKADYQLVNKKSYKVNKNDNLKKGKQKYK